MGRLRDQRLPRSYRVGVTYSGELRPGKGKAKVAKYHREYVLDSDIYVGHVLDQPPQRPDTSRAIRDASALIASAINQTPSGVGSVEARYWHSAPAAAAPHGTQAHSGPWEAGWQCSLSPRKRMRVAHGGRSLYSR